MVCLLTFSVRLSFFRQIYHRRNESLELKETIMYVLSTGEDKDDEIPESTYGIRANTL